MTADVVERPAKHEAVSTSSPREARTDIQALRALAVSMVLVYHMFPSKLPGGFVGVDVFFVISGFLITTHLIQRPPTRLIDLFSFWGRRIRRLLPASLLVLAVTIIATWLWLPETQWAPTARQTFAAGSYFVNWRLAHDAVNYLTADAAATPVQHFWSLSVEEQFYLGWPILLLVLTYLGWKLRKHRWMYAVGLALVVAASLAYSISDTASNPSAAYFVTPARIWELGTGGLVAIFFPSVSRMMAPERFAAARTAIAYLGWLTVLAIGFLYSGSTPFPSWRAGIPVLGTAVVILAAADLDWYPVGAIQKLGDISYSVYLWHFPLIIILPLALHVKGHAADFCIIVATLGLSLLTKKYVEDPFRLSPRWRRLTPTYAFGALAMAAVLLLASGLSIHENHRQTAYAAQLQQYVSGSDPCFGAGSLDSSHKCTSASEKGVMEPKPAAALNDVGFEWKPWNQRGDCLASGPAFAVVNCHTEISKPLKRVALIGNSHAAQWGPALDQLATTKKWRIDTYFAHYCPAMLTADANPNKPGCANWAAKVADTLIKQRPDLVVISDSTLAGTERSAGLKDVTLKANVADFSRMIKKLTKAGLHVLVIRDAPTPKAGGTTQTDATCLEQHTSDPAKCAGKQSAWLPADPAATAASQLHSPLATVADLTKYFCQKGTCPGLIGGAVVYGDTSHITKTYSRTLGPYLAPFVLKAIA